VIVQDAFTSFYDARVVVAQIELIARLGFRPVCLAYRESGKPLHVRGFLERFKRVAKRQRDHLARLAAAGFALVGVDPALTLIYRREYRTALPDHPLLNVQLLSEWLSDKSLPDLRPDRSFVMIQHCTERALVPATEAQWASVFARAGQASFGAKLDAARLDYPKTAHMFRARQGRKPDVNGNMLQEHNPVHTHPDAASSHPARRMTSQYQAQKLVLSHASCRFFTNIITPACYLKMRARRCIHPSLLAIAANLDALDVVIIKVQCDRAFWPFKGRSPAPVRLLHAQRVQYLTGRAQLGHLLIREREGVVINDIWVWLFGCHVPAFLFWTGEGRIMTSHQIVNQHVQRIGAALGACCGAHHRVLSSICLAAKRDAVNVQRVVGPGKDHAIVADPQPIQAARARLGAPGDSVSGGLFQQFSVCQRASGPREPNAIGLCKGRLPQGRAARWMAFIRHWYLNY